MSTRRPQSFLFIFASAAAAEDFIAFAKNIRETDFVKHPVKNSNVSETEVLVTFKELYCQHPINALNEKAEELGGTLAPEIPE